MALLSYLDGDLELVQRADVLHQHGDDELVGDALRAQSRKFITSPGLKTFGWKLTGARAAYLPLRERGQDVRVHVRLVDDGLSSDRTLLGGASSARSGLHRLQTGKKKKKTLLEIRSGDFREQEAPWVPHLSVALLRLQVIFVHLVEFVKHGRHNRKTSLLADLQNCNTDRRVGLWLVAQLAVQRK